MNSSRNKITIGTDPFTNSDGTWTSQNTPNNVYNVLDRVDPYPNYPENSPTAVDSPGQLGFQYSSLALTRDFNASMWLMFTPDGGHRVPLSKVNWHWSGTATRSGTIWTLAPSDNNTNPPGVDTEDYPAWTNNITNI
jgi:hypothetical protein